VHANPVPPLIFKEYALHFFMSKTFARFWGDRGILSNCLHGRNKDGTTHFCHCKVFI